MSLYGATFAQKLIQRGDYEKAVAEATAHATREPGSPEPYHDRARGLSLLGRYEASIADYARAIELDRTEQILPDHEVDDEVFSTVLAWCEGTIGTAQKLQVLAHYEALLQSGAHLPEAREWALRFQGLLPTTFIKPRD